MQLLIQFMQLLFFKYEESRKTRTHANTFQILPPPSNGHLNSRPIHPFILLAFFLINSIVNQAPSTAHPHQSQLPIFLNSSSFSLQFLNMTSESEAAEMHSVLERLINSINRDLALFIPFVLGFTIAGSGPTRTDSDSNSTDPDPGSENPSTPDHHHWRDRIILINPLTQGMVVVEGTRLDALFDNSPEKSKQPPASKSAIEAMPTVEIREGDEGECVIGLDEWVIGESVKEMPCKHRFHGDCIEKWLKMHRSCPVCRHTMPAEEEEGGKEERENQGRERRREISLSFSFGSPRRTEKAADSGGVDGNRSNSSDSGD